MLNEQDLLCRVFGKSLSGGALDREGRPEEREEAHGVQAVPRPLQRIHLNKCGSEVRRCVQGKKIVHVLGLFQ